MTAPTARRVVRVVRVGGADLTSAQEVAAVVERIDRLRQTGPVDVIVGPTPAARADASAWAACRDALLPRTTVLVVTPADAARLDPSPTDDANDLPRRARALRRHGATAVCIVGDPADRQGGADGRHDSDDSRAGTDPGHLLDGLSSEHADGWLASRQTTDGTAGGEVDTAESAGATAPGEARARGVTEFAEAMSRGVAAALARGFVAADAIVLARTLAATANRPTPRPIDPAALPILSFGASPRFAPPCRPPERSLGLYGIADSPELLERLLDAGLRTVQLRIKTPEQPDDAWTAALRRAVGRSVDACRAVGAELFVNDHWRLAAELGAGGVHLGQEDLLALGDSGRAVLAATGLALGVSSHSVWELCRARGLGPRYVACGPVWPTLTKAMPWEAQGLDNLHWWNAWAQAPVVAIGGILDAERVQASASCGVDGVCVVRAVAADPPREVPRLQAAMRAGRTEPATAAPTWPHPTLTRTDLAAGAPWRTSPTSRSSC